MLNIGRIRLVKEKKSENLSVEIELWNSRTLFENFYLVKSSEFYIDKCCKRLVTILATSSIERI